MRTQWDNGRTWEQFLGLNFSSSAFNWKSSLISCHWILVPKKKVEFSVISLFSRNKDYSIEATRGRHPCESILSVWSPGWLLDSSKGKPEENRLINPATQPQPLAQSLIGLVDKPLLKREERFPLWKRRVSSGASFYSQHPAFT